jgi:hypothetical protein
MEYQPALISSLALGARFPTLAGTREYVEVGFLMSYGPNFLDLTLHGICPWPAIAGWTVPLRQLKAWITYRAWSGPAARIRWQGACGHFDNRIKP